MRKANGRPASRASAAQLTNGTKSEKVRVLTSVLRIARRKAKTEGVTLTYWINRTLANHVGQGRLVEKR